MVPITFRTSDARWGAGSPANLPPEVIDVNFWELKSAIEDVIAHPPSPIQIASFELVGTGLLIHLTSGSTAGPIPLPVLSWTWRDAWVPFVPYHILDVFQVIDVGIFLVLRDHTSAATFDPAATDLSSNPLYQELFSISISPSSIATGLIAAGTNQITALQLALGWSVIETAAAGTGVMLPSGFIGTQVWIRNSGDNAIVVYPKDGDGASINFQAADAGFTIESDSAQNFRAISVTQWYSEN